MKIICTRDNFLHTLKSVGYGTGKGATLPILNNILIKTTNGGVECVSTNLEIGITCTMRAKVEEDGAVTVPAKVLHEYTQLLTSDQVMIRTEGNDLCVESTKQKTKIRGTSPDDFPVLPTVSTQERLQVLAGDLCDAFSHVIFAAAQDETRVEISGMYIYAPVAAKHVTIAATDSYRLAEQKVGIVGESPEISAIVPARTVHEMTRILDGQPRDARAELSLGSHQIVLIVNEVTLLSRLIEGRYPDYGAIIPSMAATRFTAERHEFIRAVKRASLFTRPGINDVTFAFSESEKGVVLRAGNSQLGDHEETVGGELRGGDGSVVLNYRYLLDGLNAMKTDEVSLELNNTTSPVVLRPKGEGEGYLYLIMPIKQ